MSRALKDAEKRLKAEPHNLGLRVQVASLMREAGRSTEAVELYRSVALAYRDQGRKNQAIAVCRSILDIAPDDVACNALLSELSGPQPNATTSSPPPNPSVPTLRPPTSRSTSPPIMSRAPTPTRRPLEPTPQPGPPSRPPVQLPAQPARTGSQPPRGLAPSRTSSQRSIQIPPRDSNRAGLAPTDTLRGISPVKNGVARDKSEKIVKAANRLATDAGTPPPAASRAATAPPPPPAAAARLPLEPPARRSSGQTTNPDAARRSSVPTNPDLGRRSSGEMTPLPKAIPHHLYDPTGRNKRISADDIDSHDTNPDAHPRARTPSSAGLAEAARKITGMINRDEDVSNPMDTRPVRKIKSEELRKLTQPPPTGEIQRLSDEEILTQPHDAVTKPGASHEDEELTTPRDLFDDEDD